MPQRGGASTAGGRGALICFEGLDRSGKSTQAKRLFESLKKQGKVELWRFPDRQTPTGTLIKQYLENAENLDDRAVHLLYSANRWEKMQDMVKKMEAGTTILMDRYAYSGAAYTAAKNIPGASLAWCQASDAGLPAPDLTIFLKLSATAAASRKGYGEERYENTKFQEQVYQQYATLAQQDPSCWTTLPAEEDMTLLSDKIRELVDTTLDDVRQAALSARLPAITFLYKTGLVTDHLEHAMVYALLGFSQTQTPAARITNLVRCPGSRLCCGPTL
ncbi:hypothetical protein WJX84_009772 [Apatococcus fuscideae]|uniref:Thymidylate kinase n=1 Tax=Apatococcus fuscideae TaxID=2026836 RepID=A0AAW1TA58_9CHLO